MKPQQKAPRVRPAFWLLPLVVLWLVSGLLGIGGALPYGGSNGFLGVFLALTWAAILYAAYRVLGWVMAPLLRSIPRPESKARGTGGGADGPLPGLPDRDTGERPGMPMVRSQLAMNADNPFNTHAHRPQLAWNRTRRPI